MKKKKLEDIKEIVDASSAGGKREWAMYHPVPSVLDNLSDTDRKKLEELIRHVVENEIAHHEHREHLKRVPHD